MIPQDTVGYASGGKVSVLDKPPSEIHRELNLLDQSIQATFDASQELAKRLQPILRNFPEATQDDKNPEESMSEVSGNIRRNRRAVDGINGTLRELLERLAL